MADNTYDKSNNITRWATVLSPAARILLRKRHQSSCQCFAVTSDWIEVELSEVPALMLLCQQGVLTV